MLTDLAEFRLLRAVATGQVGAFPTLWNAQVGSVWSVVRALCPDDTEALGWVTGFRVELDGRASTLDPSTPVATQVGLALLAHLLPSFADDGALPEGRVPPGEDGLRLLPARARLLYLCSLFFDLPEDGVARVAGPDAPLRVREVARRLEPAGDTDAHLAAHASLLRTPPAAALFLPPGAEPPPPPSRVGWWALAVTLVVALALSPFGRDLFFGASWSELGALHGSTLTAEGLLLESDPGLLVGRLSGEGVPSKLVEVPPLTDAGLTLVGARVVPGSPPGVVLVYTSATALFTLQHHERSLPEGGSVVATRDTPVGALAAVDTGAGVSVGWTEGGTSWILSASVPPEELLATAERVRAGRVAAPAPAPGG